MAKCIFKECRAACCRYVSVHLDAPQTRRDFDEIRWFTAHENVIVYKALDHDWIVEFKTPCNFLTRDNTCSIYHGKPDVCGIYDPDNCTANSSKSPYAILFSCPNDVDVFLEERKAKRAAQRLKSAKANKNSKL